MKILKKPSCSIRTDGRTDGHDEGKSAISQFCERTQKFTRCPERNPSRAASSTERNDDV